MNKFRLFLLAAVVLAAGLGGWLIPSRRSVQAASPPPAPQAVPVTAATSKVQNVPKYLRGIGTVQAFNTVEIKAQANGTLVSVPVREGQEVRRGDVIAEIDPRPYQAALDQATAQRAEDAAQLQSAQLDLSRFRNLEAQHFAAVQQVDDQQATVSKLIAAIQADNAAIETARINLNYCTIRAPINGRVSLYQTDVGNLIEVSSQTGIVSITQDKPISVVFTLPESQLPSVQDAMAQGKLPVLAYTSDDKTELARGTLLTPNNAINTTTGTIALKATFDNDNDRLWPGEFVNARLLLATLRNAVTVPVPAIQHGPNGLFVYTVKPDHTVADQAIDVGYQDATTAVVTKGLQGGQSVVVAGQSRLAPGVRVAESGGDSASQSSSSARATNVPNGAARHG